MKNLYLFIFAIAILSCSKKDLPTIDVPKDPPAVTVPPASTGETPTITNFLPTSAEKGNDVTITGTGFGTDINKISVSFIDGSLATIKNVTDTKIIFIVPATKSGQLTVIINATTIKPTQAFTFIPDYIVKTIGISRIMVAADENSRLTVAELFGGGNRIVLKQGTGNKMEFLGNSISVIPDALGTPQGTVQYLNQLIDNGNSAIDTSGSTATVVKLKGFDKAKTGYNQLNLVMHVHVWKRSVQWAGFETNLAYLKMTKAPNKTNQDYGINYIKSLFSGNINVSTVEIAKPRSEKPYITRDLVFSNAIAVSGVSEPKALDLDLKNIFDRTYFSNESNGSIAVGKPLKFEWVNADNAMINKDASDRYSARFSNIKVGGLDQVVEPTDSISKVFLRITGFNADVTGFHQMRLFIANDGYFNGDIRVQFNSKPVAAPSLSFMKEVYRTGQNLYCASLEPVFQHY